MATPSGPPVSPARAMAMGKMLASPRPATAKPAQAVQAVGASAPSSMPAVAVIPPAISARAAPKRCTTAVPVSRPMVIASANTAYPAAAVPGPAARSWERCSAPQSAMAPSP